jgi:hypothetical protein
MLAVTAAFKRTESTINRPFFGRRKTKSLDPCTNLFSFRKITICDCIASSVAPPSEEPKDAAPDAEGETVEIERKAWLVDLPSNRRLSSRRLDLYADFRIRFRKLTRNAIMPIRQKKKSLSEFRQRQRRRGVVRLEVHVRKDDAALVRGVVTALSDPSRESETRSLLREHFGASRATGLKALLVSAPLEGIDLSRKRDFGRDVEL